MAGPRPKRSSYTPKSSPAVANPGRTFSVPGSSSGTRADDVSPTRSKSRAGLARFNISQQTGAPKSKTR